MDRSPYSWPIDTTKTRFLTQNLLASLNNESYQELYIKLLSLLNDETPNLHQVLDTRPHTSNDQTLFILKESTLPDAGKGVFPTIRIQKGEFLGFYPGPALIGANIGNDQTRFSDLTEMYTERLVGLNYTEHQIKIILKELLKEGNSQHWTEMTPYALGYGFKEGLIRIVYDASRKRSPIAYINCALNPNKANCKVTSIHKKGLLPVFILKATKPIRPNQEILYPYSKGLTKEGLLKKETHLIEFAAHCDSILAAKGIRR